MLRASYLLQESINKISRMGKSLTANSDLEVLKKRLQFEYRNALVSFGELSSTVDSYHYENQIEKALDALIEDVAEVQQETDWEVIKQILILLPTRVLGDFIKDLDTYDLKFYARKHHHEHSDAVVLDELDLRNISRIFSSQTNRPINFLDARCGNGYNVSMINMCAVSNINFYGMEKDPSDANSAKDRDCFYKIAKGGLNGSKCSNDVFDVALLTPTLKYEAEFTPMNTLRPRKEVDEFKQVTKYIREGGLLIFVIPYYRLTSQLCTLIARNYKDVSIGETRRWPDMIVIAGIKIPDDKEPNEEIYNLLRQASLLSPSASTAIERRLKNDYILPPDLLEVSLFRGNVLDDEDIIEIINDSNLYASFMEQQTNILESTHDQQPLLPFNMGQIGLVLTSGCLDGEIEELDGQYHVIKGMVKKDTIIEEVPTERRGDKETRTTFVNKVQINVITPDGTIKTLA